MEGLKEAINFIADLAVKANGGTVHEVDGLRYYMCGGRMIPLEYEPKLQEPIVATTLTSLFEYIIRFIQPLRERIRSMFVPSSRLLNTGKITGKKSSSSSCSLALSQRMT